MKFPRPKVIAVDVDGTLIVGGKPNARLIRVLRVRKTEGFSLTLWSARGEGHARKAAARAECAELFDHILSKPGYIFDDRGWSWVRYTARLRA